MSLSLSFTCSQRQEQRQTLSQHLSFEFHPESPFKEPDGHTALKSDRQGKFFEVDQSDLEAYVSAVRVASGLVLRHKPHFILVAMRGAYPFSQALQFSLTADDQFAEVMRMGAGIHSPPPMIHMSTSYYLDNLQWHTKSALLRGIREVGIRGREELRIMMLDTSVTGTKLSWFLPSFVEGIEDFSKHIRPRVSLDFVVLRPDNGYAPVDAPRTSNVVTRMHDIVVPHLITEDVAALLGKPKRFQPGEIRREAIGSVRADQPIPKADIRLTGQGEGIVYSADTFGSSAAGFRAALKDAYRATAGQEVKHPSVRLLSGARRAFGSGPLVESLLEMKVVEDLVLRRAQLYPDMPGRSERDHLTLAAALTDFRKTSEQECSRFAWDTPALLKAQTSVENFVRRMATEVRQLVELESRPLSIAEMITSSSPRNRIQTAVARAHVMDLFGDGGKQAAAAYGVDLEYVPHDALASFVVLNTVTSRYDVALLIGPEGFAFQPILEGVGCPIVAINIPEIVPNGERTVRILDEKQMQFLDGKRVLIVEDDVRSGATLRAALESIPGKPAKIGLFLGSPPQYQKLENVPVEISEVHTISDKPITDLSVVFDSLSREWGIRLYRSE